VQHSAEQWFSMHGMAASGAEATQGNVAVTTKSTALGILWHIPCRDCALPRPLTSLPEGFVPRELQDQLTPQQVESLAILTTHDQLTASQCDAFSQSGYAADPSQHGGGRDMQKRENARRRRFGKIRAAEADVMAARPPAFDVMQC
jgi:hypothetical protein